MSIMNAVALVGDPVPPKVVYVTADSENPLPVAGTFSADPPVGAATEAKQDDGIALLTTIDADTSALAGAVSGSEVQVDVVGALPAGTNAIGKLAANSGVDIGDVDVTSIAAGENHLGEVGGNMSAVAVTLTRPADTNAYIAKDTISDSTSSPNYLTFSNVARVNQGTGYIIFARLLTDQSANIARYRLHLFHTAPTAINDNSPYTLLWANRASRIGYIDFEACQTEGSGSDMANSQNTWVRLAFQCASGSRAIYGILELLDAFTPASAQNFYIELRAECN